MEASRGLEPVCNKINRGVARERTRGCGGGGREERSRSEREARGGGPRRAGAPAAPGGAGGRGDGRQNHPAGYSHPLDEATDCDGVPPPPTSTSSRFLLLCLRTTPPPVCLKLWGYSLPRSDRCCRPTSRRPSRQLVPHRNSYPGHFISTRTRGRPPPPARREVIRFFRERSRRSADFYATDPPRERRLETVGSFNVS